MNMLPLSGKQNWSWHSSQPTPRAAKTYLLENPWACLLNPKGKLWSMCCLFALIDYFTIHFQPLAYSMEILFYSIFPRTLSFMILLLFSTQQEPWPNFGEDVACITSVFTNHFSPFVFSSCGSTNTLLTTTSVLIPLGYLINK